MKRILLFFSVLALAVASCWAQEDSRHEITVQGSGFFGKTTTGSGVSNQTTNSGGAMAGYRFNINKWLAAEGDYDFSSNSQKYVTAAGNYRTQTYLHGVTGIGIVKLPALANMKPFVLAGGGALVFDPRNNASIERQTRGTFVYGGGADVRVMKHVAVRGQYRGFIYKTPDFGTAQLKTDKFTHAAVPSAGLVFTF